MNPWVWIVMGGLIESVWAVTLNMSEAFTVPLWTIVTIVIALASVLVLDIALKKGVPPGAGYAAWVGCGACFSTAAGFILYGQTLSPAGWFFFAILLAGVLLMQASENQRDQ